MEGQLCVEKLKVYFILNHCPPFKMASLTIRNYCGCTAKIHHGKIQTDQYLILVYFVLLSRACLIIDHLTMLSININNLSI